LCGNEWFDFIDDNRHAKYNGKRCDVIIGKVAKMMCTERSRLIMTAVF
jgi:hypothetical protein